VTRSGGVTASVVTPQRVKDRIFMICFAAAMVAAAAFSLGSVGYLLGFNSTTLIFIALGFTAMSLNFMLERAQPVGVQLTYVALAVIPIGARMALNMPLFEQLVASSTSPVLQQVGYAGQIVGLWNLVAVAEEAFRAAMLNIADLFAKFRDREIQDRYRILFANTVWIAFHFFQRPMDLGIYWKYILWLYIAGLVMTYALTKAGLGSATLIHLITNLTA